MTKWQAFLNSLSTPGGNLFLLVWCVLLLLVLVVILIFAHPKDAALVTVVSTTFSGFAGALLQAFKGRSSDVPPTNSTVSTSTDSHVETKS